MHIAFEWASIILVMVQFFFYVFFLFAQNEVDQNGFCINGMDFFYGFSLTAPVSIQSKCVLKRFEVMRCVAIRRGGFQAAETNGRCVFHIFLVTENG